MSMKLLDQYEFYVGIEEEAFTLNDEGFLTPHAYRVAESLLKKLRDSKEFLMDIRKRLMGLQWEPSPTQIEYVTRPLPLSELLETIRFSREILGQNAEENGLILGYLSMHPIQSTPLPINGTHINISFKEEGMQRPPLNMLNYVANHLRNHLPELIAITANTPMMNGVYTGYASNRLMYSKVLKETPYSQIVVRPIRVIPPAVRSRFRYGVVFEKIRRYIRRIEVNPEGDRLVDLAIRGPVTNILEDMFKDPETTRIEARFIDNQLDTDYLHDTILLILGIIMDGIVRYRRNWKLKPRRNLSRLRWEAITNGVNGIAEDGRTFKERIEEVAGIVEKYLEQVGYMFKTSLKHGVPEQSKKRIKVVDENPQLTEYRLTGHHWLKIRVTDNRYVYTLDGRRKRIEPGDYHGIHMIQYSMEYMAEKGLLKEIKTIYARHILYTREGYIPLSKGDRILEVRKPLERFSILISNYLNNKGYS